jgi:DNA-binding beta-propeller fold protein YncE
MTRKNQFNLFKIVFVGVAMDSNDVLYFADVANAAVFFREQPTSEIKNPEMQVLVKDFEGMPLKGPSSICLHKEENSLFVCDSGYFGTSSLNSPGGSLYIVDLDTRVSRSILLNCISCPADITIDESNGIGYLVETYSNRVLRLMENPNGVHHTSVFHQFNGRVGPSAIAIDALGNIYVARYEFQNSEKEVDGLISVLNKDGHFVGELIIPRMPEITGMCIPSGKKADTLYFTEKSFNGILKIKLSQFAAEIDKMLENNKFF